MSITEQLRRVGCVSDFEDRPIDDALLGQIVEAAAWAPSAANAQPWEILALRDPQQKQALVATLLDSHLRPDVGGDERREWVAAAPLILVVCLDHTRAKVRYGPLGEALFGPQDSGAAIQNLRLAALEQGVKSCLIREFDRSQLAKILELPAHVRPLILIVMGFSELEARPGPCLPLADFLHLERW